MARSLGGSPDHLNTATPPVTTYPVTMACWFNQNAAANTSLMSLGNSSDDAQRYRLRLLTAGTVSAIIDSGSADSGTTTNTASPGTWNHAGGVFGSATSRTAYLNGVKGGTGTSNLTPTGQNRMGIGARVGATTSDYFIGKLAEICVWNVALTENEMTALAAMIFSPEQIRVRSLVFYLPLGSASETFMGTSMTLSGTTGWPSPDFAHKSFIRKL